MDYWCTSSGVFHMNCSTWINGVPVHVDIRWISCEECHPFLFHMFSTRIFHMDYRCRPTNPRVYLTCNPLCISHVDCLCKFSGVFHVSCFTWNGVPVHVDITWIFCEKCHLILFHLFSTCIFYMDLIGVPIHVYIWWISYDG